MSATIAWVIDWIQCKPTEGQFTDIVITVGWRCNGNETASSVDYSASIYSSVSLPMPEGSFTPYADLTQDQVLGWVWANGVDKEATETAVQQQIDNQINPPMVTPELPWATA